MAEHLRTEDVRIKHKPSLGSQGVHGRHNKEAVGCALHPFSFECDSVSLAVPNPVTWSVMKLTAMNSFWNEANKPDEKHERRARLRKQAEKHAQDVCRTVAMMTIEERDHAEEVVEAIGETEPYKKAAGIISDAFLDRAWAGELVREYWQAEDLEIIHGILGSWYNA